MFSTGTSIRTGRIFWMLALLTVLVLTLVVTPVSASPSTPLELGYVRITNVRETTFNISWVTNEPSNGWARCYTPSGTLVGTAYDPLTNTTTHYVSFTGLSSLTSYLCEVESGGVVLNNFDTRYPVITGATLGIPPAGGTRYGQVFLSDGVTPANGAIVYLRLIDVDGAGSPGRSQWVSSQVAQGYWFIDFNSIRTADLTAYFAFTQGQDQMEIWVQGGVVGTWGRPLLPEAVLPIPVPGSTDSVVLNGIPLVLPEPPLAITLSALSAASQEDSIVINWETVSETDSQGFNLYRAMDSAGPQDLLAFVPSQAPGSNQGASYEWLDADVAAGETYFYWLEAVDLSGATTLHGPVSATYQAPTAVDVTTFTAQAMDSSALTPWLLALPALLGGAAYGLRRRSRRPAVK